MWMIQAFRVCKPGGFFGVFTDWRQLPVITGAVQAAGWIWRGIVVWDKTLAARPQLGRYRNQCEYMVWATKGKHSSTGAVLPGCCTIGATVRDKCHIAGKPIELFRNLLRIVPEGGLAIDPFAGSGTTLIAAKDLGLRYMGCEMEKEFVDIARMRLAGKLPCPHPTGSLLV